MPGGRSLPPMLSAAVLTVLTLVAGCGGGAGGPAAQPPATASTAPTASTTGASPAAKTYFPQYGTSTHAYKPRRLEPSVDGSLSVGAMDWRVWNSHRAVGDGVAHVNDCKPDCADGHFTAHRVTVHLTRPRELCGSEFFTAIRLTGPDYRTRAVWSGIGCG